MSTFQNEGWIAVDFDGTLATHDHYRGEGHTGEPIEAMVKKVRKWVREGRDVRLFTARKPSPVLRRWMRDHLGIILPITNVKDPHMIAFFDDKAVAIKKNTGEPYHPDNEKEVLRNAL